MALLLRFRLYYETGKWRKLQLGRFRLPITNAQKLARDALYELMLKDEEVDIHKLESLFHPLADALLRMNIPAMSKIGCASDVVLVLSTVMSNGSFDPDPNALTHACARIQFDFRSIHLTIARLLHERQLTYSSLPDHDAEMQIENVPGDASTTTGRTHSVHAPDERRGIDEPLDVLGGDEEPVYILSDDDDLLK